MISVRELKFMFAICRRPSVCRLSVCNVRAPYSDDIFGNVSMPFGTLAIHDLCIKIFYGDRPREPSVGGVKIQEV